MASVSRRDAAAMLDLVREGAQATGSELFPPRVLELLLSLIPADGLAGYQEVDVTDGGCRLIERVELLCKPVPSSVHEASRRYSRQDPMRDPSRFREARVLRLSDFFSRRQLARLDFYAEVWHPLGIDDCLRVWFPAPDRRARVLFLERGRIDFTERDRTILELLRPHLDWIRANAAFRRHASHALGLTDREAEVLGWIAEGKTNGEVGTILFLSPNTVRKHVENIFEKLGVHTRTAAAARMRQAMTPAAG